MATFQENGGIRTLLASTAALAFAVTVFLFSVVSFLTAVFDAIRFLFW